MDESLLVHGAPDLKMPKPGRNAHGVRALGNDGTLLCVAECFVGDDQSAQFAVEAAMSAYGKSDEPDGFDRARAAILAANDQLRSRGTDRCALALVAVRGGRAWVAWLGPIRVLLVRGKSIVSKTTDNKQTIGGAGGTAAPDVSVMGSVWGLEQSDRLLMWTSPIFECVEETLLPNLLENRPPDRCVESVLKLANYRGLTEDYAMLVAAWQDPALATQAVAFRAEIDFDDKTTGGNLVREGFPDQGFALLTGDSFTTEPPPERLDTDSPVPVPEKAPQAEVAPKEGSSNVVALVAVGVIVVGLGVVAIAAVGAIVFLL